MTLTRKDAAATALTALVVLVFVAKAYTHAHTSTPVTKTTLPRSTSPAN